MFTRSSFLKTVTSVLAVLVVFACSSPLTGPPASASLSITIGDQLGRTLAPALDMHPVSYAITGTGPAGATFTASSTGGTVTKTGLAFGTWTVVANATNAGGTLIGSGSGTAQVNTAATTAVTVNVTPVSGTGTLSLGVNWPAAQVQTPSINATLTPALGAVQSLPFIVSGSTASYSSSTVGNGYYTLGFTLLDNSSVVAGAVEVVRIVTGQTTSGTYSFANVNAPGGTIEVGITANMQDPLSVAVAGASATQPVGSTMALTAGVSNYAGNVVYVWYVNGVSAGTGPTFNFDAGSVIGYSYRVDVTAFSADGTRAGSATTNVQAVAQTVFQGNGVWAKNAGGTWLDTLTNDTQGNIYVTSSGRSENAMDFGNGVLLPATGIDQQSYVLKLNSYGQAQKVFAPIPRAGTRVSFNKSAVDSVGNLYVVGAAYSMVYGSSPQVDFGNSVVLAPSQGWTTGFLVKYDITGHPTLLLSSPSSSSNRLTFLSVVRGAGDRLFVVGSVQSDGNQTFQFGPSHSVKPSAGSTFFFVRLTSTGDVESVHLALQALNGQNLDQVVVANTSEGASIVAFRVNSSTTSFPIQFGQGFSVPNWGMVLTRVEADGTISWLKYVAESSLFPYDLALDSSGNILLAFNVRLAFDFGNGVGLPSSSIAQNIALAKFDALGNALWARGSLTRFTTGGLGYSSFNGLTVAPDDSIYVAGVIMTGTEYDLGDGFVVEGSAGGNQYVENALVARYTPTGHVTWVKRGGPNTRGSKAIFDHGGLYVAGTHSNPGSVTSLPGDTSLANPYSSWAGFVTKLE